MKIADTKALHTMQESIQYIGKCALDGVKLTIWEVYADHQIADKGKAWKKAKIHNQN